MKKVALVQAPIDANRYYLPEEAVCWRNLHLLRYQLQFRAFLTPDEFLALENVKKENYGLLSLAASLLAAGYQVSYQAPNDYAEIDFADLLSADVVGISCLTATYPSAIRIAQFVRKAAHRSIKVLLGGPHARAQAHSILENTNGTFDYIVTGFAENRLAPLLERILGGSGRVCDIAGLAYRENGGPILTTGTPETVSLDEIPLPAVHLVPGMLIGARIHTSFGCPYRCVFCNLHGATSHHYKSTSRLRTELTILKEQKNTRFVYVGDPLFGHNLTRVRETSQLMNELGLYWQFQTKASRIRVPLLEILEADRYFCGLEFGVETLDAGLLQRISKLITPGQIGQALARGQAAGLKLLTYWMFGLPGMSPEIARKDFNAMAELVQRNVLVHLNWMVPYPGSQFFEAPAQWQIELETLDWGDYYSGGYPVYSLLAPRLARGEMMDLYCEGVRRISEAAESMLEPSTRTAFKDFQGITVYRGLF